MAERSIPIGELSRQTGCNIETIRYYERVGLLPEPERRGRYRRYGRDDLARLAFVRRARELGFSLDDIRALIGLAAEDDSACEPARALAAAHLADVRRRIQDLRRMERVLAESVRACDAGGAPTCPIIDALSAAPSAKS